MEFLCKIVSVFAALTLLAVTPPAYAVPAPAPMPAPMPAADAASDQGAQENGPDNAQDNGEGQSADEPTASEPSEASGGEDEEPKPGYTAAAYDPGPERQYGPAPQRAGPFDYVSYHRAGTVYANRDKPTRQRDEEAIEFRALTSSCNRGSVSACYELGKAYELGMGTHQNRPIAAILFGEGCDADHAPSCTAMGGLARIALDDEWQIDSAAAQNALVLFEKACLLGDLGGCARVGEAKAEGQGTEQDPAEAEALWRASCELGGTLACRFLAGALLEEGRSVEEANEAVGLLARECRDLDLASCRDLLAVDTYAETMPPNEETLGYACSAGSPDHCLRLADEYMTGYTVVHDRDYAEILFRRACELDERPYFCYQANTLPLEQEKLTNCDRGDSDACAWLGRFYWFDPYLRDFAKGQEYHEIACLYGIGGACYELGNMYLKGANPDIGIVPEKADEFLQLSCTAGHLDGCEDLAEELVEGEVLERDDPRAYVLLEDVCGKGKTTACLLLEELAAQDPAAPMALATSDFVPPIDPDAEPEPDPVWEAACQESTIMFRGKEYYDVVCARVVLKSIGGYPLRPGQAPWQALLWRPAAFSNGRQIDDAYRVLCGGSLIREGWILTAAHCLEKDQRENPGLNLKDYRIRLGVHNPNNNEGESFPIERVYNHPQFNSASYEYDIALLRYNPRRGMAGTRRFLPSRISLDNRPVAARRARRGQPVYAYGWGWTQWAPNRNFNTTDELRGVRMLLSSEDECQAITGNNFAALCAAGPNGEQACKGDSGGPLITYSDIDRIPRVIGVVSAGRGCGTSGEASRYARVGAVINWINAVMNGGR